MVTAVGAWETDDDAPLLVEALDRLGISAGPVRWDDPDADWGSFDLVVVKSPWDYTDRPDQFLQWAESTAAMTPVLNPVEIIRWNSDKRYLAELADFGLPVVPTHYLSPSDLSPGGWPGGSTGEPTGGPSPLTEVLLAQFPGDDLSGSIVVKPTVSVGSKDTARYDSGQVSAAAEHATALLRDGREVMVQPYFDTVELSGETGLVFFRGVFSHAFRKGPLLSQGASNVDGLYAVEDISPRTPSSRELSLANSIVAAVQSRFPTSDLLYTRVDLLENDDRQPFLLELELIEPSYFLVTDPAGPERAATAYQAALTKVRGGRPPAVELP